MSFSWSKASAGAAQQAGAQQAAQQAMKMGTAAVPGGQGFQFFPVQVGGPTPYARSRRPIFVGICIYQALMAVMALIEFANFLSGIVMILGLMVAVWAFKEHMNITYICWWGVLCLVGFVAGLVGAFMGFAVQLMTICAKFNIPFSCFLGMGLAWLLYADYEAEHHCTDTVGSWLRALGLLKEPPPPEASNASWLPQFGNSGQFGSDIQKQAGGFGAMAAGYGAMGKDQMGGMQAQGNSLFGNANAQGNAAYGQASSYGAGMFGSATDAASQGKSNLFATNANLPQGRHAVSADPFMTL